VRGVRREEGLSPEERVSSVKLHESRCSGSKNLTLICELSTGALFSNGFWNEPGLRFQEREQFVSEMWAGMPRGGLIIQGKDKRS